MTLRGEAKETAGVTSALLLSYLDRVGGAEAVHAVLERCGLQDCEAELRDENSWFSWETKIALFEATADVLQNPRFLSDLAAFALDANVAGGLKVALRTLGSPEFVLRNIVRANARFNRSHVLELLALEPGHARLQFSEIGGGRRHHHLDCEYTAALLAVIPELFGIPPASVGHGQCAAAGAEACIFDLRWEEHPRHRRRIALGGLVSLAATGISALLLPPALPVAGAAVVIVAGLLLRDHRRWQRERWRHLERQAEDSEEVAQRLFASLQDLVSDLRLEEVVAKVTRNAQDAMGGREFLLLVREGDGVICQSSSDLPGAAVAAVEAWANGSADALHRSLLIDDVSALPALAALATLPNPHCSVASAPLVYGGEALGLLVALGGQQRAFLPRDMSVLESYAAQVAIALGNARLYQNERSLAARDPLTGLLNHRSFHEALDAQLSRCAREHFYSSLVLVDLDDFKRVNDEDGHAAGDRVLRAAARALSDACRSDDLAFRVGGDEFALLLPRLVEEEAVRVADRICAAISGIDPRMGASAGVCTAAPGEQDKNALIAKADRRLYAAKHQGPTRGERAGHGLWAESEARAVTLLSAALELHDGATADHSDVVARLSVSVAIRMGLSGRELEFVRRAALVHDVGKLSIPRELLHKPSSLTQEEWLVVRGHTTHGAELLKRDPALAPLAPVVRGSHERWDGTGYPDGLAGEEIPLAARIIAACDAFDAMTADRPYRPARSPAEAIAELEACAGTQFDPDVISALVAETADIAGVGLR